MAVASRGHGESEGGFVGEFQEVGDVCGGRRMEDGDGFVTGHFAEVCGGGFDVVLDMRYRFSIYRTSEKEGTLVEKHVRLCSKVAYPRNRNLHPRKLTQILDRRLMNWNLMQFFYEETGTLEEIEGTTRQGSLFEGSPGTVIHNVGNIWQSKCCNGYS
ncbi:hypothetical protein L1987_08554 [Smallanthus sonchifolius]|uniref:Uncharacterized protein n=1 Tax=Smallanthus sonchifolius TaxID=185202 RepID=A0ACB9JMW8_9ASTR|nr:hypothetical protein L1987_08554 [Smallanthus sonchifolius]